MNELKMTVRRTRVGDVFKQQFYQVPKFVFREQFKGLTNDARVLYALLLERHNLSIKNKWVNDNGEVFLLYKQERMAEDIGVSERTIRRAICKLEAFGLLSQERQGLNMPNKLYVSSVDIEETLEKSGAVNLSAQEGQICPPNKTNINKTNKEEIEKLSNAHSQAHVLDVLPQAQEVFEDDNFLEDDAEESFIPPELDENQRKDKSVIKQAVKAHSIEWANWALKFVDDYIDKHYPAMTGRQHPNLKTFSKAMRMTFAVKILDCMDETSCKTREDMITAIGCILKNRDKKHPNINPTIYWLTNPRILGYGILCTHDDGWESVRGTEYEPMQDYFW